jgi:oligopeptide/dipeptide ABC transporter ATP-binding protein
MNSALPLLQVRNLSKHFSVGEGLFFSARNIVKAVDGVSFDIERGEILSLVGESGSGKSTVGRTVLRLTKPTNGTICFDGTDITSLSRGEMRPFRKRMQLIFQDPYASLNPKMDVETIVSAPLVIQEPAMSAAKRRERVERSLEMVGLLPGHLSRYPHEFSGGQRQRVGIARALITEPELLIADEPVSALDVSIQAQVINLILEVKERLGLTILLISHDLAVVGLISDRIAVMYLGRIVEIAPTRTLLTNLQHPYTEALLSAAPQPDPTIRRERIMLVGDIPSPLNPPSGCTFRTRCRYAQPECAAARPELREVQAGHYKACIRDDLALRAML